MAILHVSIATTLDGFITDDNGSMDWIIRDDERATCVVELLKNTDTLSMGPDTYQIFASGWPELPTQYP